MHYVLCLTAQAHGSLMVKPFPITDGFLSCISRCGLLNWYRGRSCNVIRYIPRLGCGCTLFTATGDMPTDASIVSYAMTEWKTKVRFIGVGTIGIAAIWTLLILLKPMIEGMVHSFRMLKGSQAESENRIDVDLSPKTIIYIFIGDRCINRDFLISLRCSRTNFC